MQDGRDLQQEAFPAAHAVDSAGTVEDLQGDLFQGLAALLRPVIAPADLMGAGNNILFKIMGGDKVFLFLRVIVDDTIAETDAGEPEKVRSRDPQNLPQDNARNKEQGHIFLRNLKSPGHLRIADGLDPVIKSFIALPAEKTVAGREDFLGISRAPEEFPDIDLLGRFRNIIVHQDQASDPAFFQIQMLEDHESGQDQLFDQTLKAGG